MYDVASQLFVRYEFAYTNDSDVHFFIACAALRYLTPDDTRRWTALGIPISMAQPQYPAEVTRAFCDRAWVLRVFGDDALWMRGVQFTNDRHDRIDGARVRRVLDGDGMPCSNCGKCRELPLRRCSKCYVARYCGAQCQRDDWTAHRDLCPALARMAADLIEDSLP